MTAELEPAPSLVLPFPALVHPLATMEEQEPAGPEPRAGPEGGGKVPRVVQAGTGRVSPRWLTPQQIKQEPLEEPVQRWQVTVHRQLEDVALDMEGPGALREPLCSWLEWAQTHPGHVPLEEAGWRETPGPQEELPCVPKEEPPFYQEPDSPDTEETWDSSADESPLGCFPRRGCLLGAAGSGTLSTAEERPLEEGPVTLELLGPSPGRSGERRLPTTVPGQVHQKQGRHPQQRENVAVSKLPEAFEDVAVYFTRKEWELLEAEDKGLYRDQMLRNYQALVSLGYRGPTPDLICRIQRGEMELWVSDDEEAGESSLSEDLSPESAARCRGKSPGGWENGASGTPAASAAVLHVHQLRQCQNQDPTVVFERLVTISEEHLEETRTWHRHWLHEFREMWQGMEQSDCEDREAWRAESEVYHAVLQKLVEAQEKQRDMVRRAVAAAKDNQCVRH
ncbi:neurotrophin receptor-interacting factor homolog isoform X1 [Alligator mississippiensis]|uniref:neurotrophin receptor-interacting factor homolog isoform X1 n=1 Tax=Alligator mississippiensis TaxID=8496 RepID=UPI0006ECBCBB|nr:neurotrophin receptor-interacting factor homolog isoform X1 [Alligator mississippiensis]XP_059574938.1 neurotrophin receptor-interacting factor homolog isoform X1 [Alligator mississippiensis]XP_059574939.1 neurotrophin receptor-interacting factor homolog isoform X1 [Alligator mississippiensis]XP_059574940.1 neurotrophin receptor-interacting factor homolog isoform X1 [Alligator mississippiensis]